MFCPTHTVYMLTCEVIRAINAEDSPCLPDAHRVCKLEPVLLYFIVDDCHTGPCHGPCDTISSLQNHALSAHGRPSVSLRARLASGKHRLSSA